MGVVSEFARSLASAVAGGGPGFNIDRAVWGRVLEPLPQRRGTWLLSDGDARVEVTRLDSLYGYLRVSVGGCRFEGVLEYRQWHVVFKPQRVEGDCSAFRGQGYRGIEVVEEEEE